MLEIMIVDDEPIALSAISKFIRAKYPSLKISGTYNNSIEAYQAFCESPADILLTDIHMPIMDGLELIEKLLGLPSHFVPIIISGYNEFSYAKTAMRLGVIHYLLKPIDFDELTQSLNSAVYKIRQNQLLYAETDFLQENRELFFMDLIMGRLNAAALLNDRFDRLSFPFSLEKSPGVLLRISLLSTPQRFYYERETLSIVFENFLRLLYQPQCISTIVRAQNHFDIFIIRPNKTLTVFSDLIEQVRTLAGLSIAVELIRSFSSLENMAYTAEEEASLPLLSESDGHPCQECIDLAIAYMQEHYAEDLSREKVASIFYLSSAHFSRLLKQKTGISFLNLLTEIRMQKAIALLNTNMKVQDVGKAVGYPSRNRFFINFKNYTSYTPTEYRRNVLKIMT